LQRLALLAVTAGRVLRQTLLVLGLFMLVAAGLEALTLVQFLGMAVLVAAATEPIQVVLLFQVRQILGAVEAVAVQVQLQELVAPVS
jgi:hypothetical protein